jgi:indolepyruvate ferredoxin oxidoreductase
MERALLKQYEGDIDRLVEDWAPGARRAAVALARLPLEIRGFGPVKAAAAQAAETQRSALMAEFEAGRHPRLHAAE